MKLQKEDLDSGKWVREKLQTVLLRVKNTMRALPSVDVDGAGKVLDDLGVFAEAKTVGEVEKLLGGKKKLATKIFHSVMDEDERAMLELMASGPNGRNRHEKKNQAATERVEALLNEAVHFARFVDVESLKQDSILKRVLDVLPLPPFEEANRRLRDGSDDDDDDDDSPQQHQQQEVVIANKKRVQSSSLKTKIQPKKAAKKSTKTVTKEKASSSLVVAPVTEEEESDGENVESSGSSDGEEKEEMELESNSTEILRLFCDAEQEFDDIGRISINFVQESDAQRVEAPNPASVCAATKIEDEGTLRACFCDEIVPFASVEGVGTLLSWFRLVTRACRMRGVFLLIRAQKGGGKKIQTKFAALAEKVSDRALSFVQATKYERLGKFLIEYPRFVQQRKFVTLADWLQKIDDHATLIDSVLSIVPVSSVFLKDCFELHKDGFQVYPSIMSNLVSETLIQLCMDECGEKGDVLFNNGPIRSRHNDKKRRQLSVSRLEANEEMKMFEQALIGKLKGLFPNHKADSVVVLLSLDGCAAQLAHTDYSPSTLENVIGEDAKIPLGALVALTDGTAFDVWPKAIRFDDSQKFKPQQIKLRAGDVCVFRGDLVHGGAAVVEKNVRMHVYLDTTQILRPKYDDGAVEQTHFMHKSAHILPRK